MQMLSIRILSLFLVFGTILPGQLFSMTPRQKNVQDFWHIAGVATCAGAISYAVAPLAKVCFDKAPTMTTCVGGFALLAATSFVAGVSAKHRIDEESESQKAIRLQDPSAAADNSSGVPGVIDQLMYAFDSDVEKEKSLPNRGASLQIRGEWQEPSVGNVAAADSSSGVPDAIAPSMYALDGAVEKEKSLSNRGASVQIRGEWQEPSVGSVAAADSSSGVPDAIDPSMYVLDGAVKKAKSRKKWLHRGVKVQSVSWPICCAALIYGLKLGWSKDFMFNPSNIELPYIPLQHRMGLTIVALAGWGAHKFNKNREKQPERSIAPVDVQKIEPSLQTRQASGPGNLRALRFKPYTTRRNINLRKKC